MQQGLQKSLFKWLEQFVLAHTRLTQFELYPLSRRFVLALWFACLSSLSMFSGASLAEGTMQQTFKQADITTVIESVAKLSGKNFIIDPRVKGKVTFIAPQGMQPSELYESLLAVLNVHGYVAVEGKGGIKIIPANLARDQIPYRQGAKNNEQWVTQVITVRHVNASKLVAVLRPLVAREGHLVALSESNKLIVSDTVANIGRLKNILQRVDVDVAGSYEVINVANTSAVDLVKTLKSVVPKSQNGIDVKIGVDPRSNRIILSGDELKRMMLRALIADLDIKVDADGGVQVIYLRYAKAKDIAPILQKIAGNKALQVNADEPAKSQAKGQANGGSSKKGATASSSAGLNTALLDKSELKEQINIEADERMNALVISAPSAVMTGLKKVIEQLDIRRAQVLIEAIFVEVSADKAAELGVEWGLNTSSGAGLVNFSGAIPSLIGNAGNLLEQSQVIGRGITLGGGDLDGNNQGWGALIRALNSNSASNILATPSVLTLDNEEAEILVGREVPFQTGSYTNTNNSVSNPFSTIERQNVGLKLKVTPQINEGNEVYLEIDQEVSDVLPKGEAVDIQTTKRQIKTRVIVGDGNMIVLGGLIDEKEIKTKSKVPGLGDLPGVGHLFSSSEDSRQRVNLMVFIRPLIIRDNEMSNYYSQKKYRTVLREQKNMLENDEVDLLNGLRPRLPSLQEWQNQNNNLNNNSGNTSVNTSGNNSNSASATVRQEPEPKPSKEDSPLVYEATTDELLGF